MVLFMSQLSSLFEGLGIRDFNRETDFAEAERIARSHYSGIAESIPLGKYFENCPDLKGLVHYDCHQEERLRSFLLYTAMGNSYSTLWYQKDGTPNVEAQEKIGSILQELGLEYPKQDDLEILIWGVDQKIRHVEIEGEKEGMSASFLGIQLLEIADGSNHSIITCQWDKDQFLEQVYLAFGFQYITTLLDVYAPGEDTNILIRPSKMR